MLKIYYKLELRQTSPLHLSNGDSDITDSDLMKDSRGLPLIPGTGLTGAMRVLMPEKEAEKLFGWIRGEKQQASRVLVSDGTLPAGTKESDIHLIHRDGVGLDLFRGTALNTAKYDFEAVETDLPYTAVLEWTGDGEDQTAELLENLVAQLAGDGLFLGGKTTRGYGAMRVAAWKKCFEFPKDLPQWLAFSPAGYKEGWTAVKPSEGQSSFREYRLNFEVCGPVSVRVYSSGIGQADFSPLQNHDGQALIPGTSWAGSFRHRMHELGSALGFSPEEDKAIDALFGKREEDMVKSPIRFSETALEGGQLYELTRNALDRFTGGPAMSSLYTAGYWQGGRGELVIRVENPQENLSPLLEQLLLAAIQDLNLGLMTIGGGAAVGLGRVRVSSLQIDGAAVKMDMEVTEA